MRTYFKLLRLPYQLQLGPIFLWGYWLGGGTLHTWAEAARFLAIFAIFHIGAFGGLTALNSFYDRDEGPIGGLWNPPPVPPRLFEFAWSVQLGGLVLIAPFGPRLAWIYCALLVLSLLYSHPLTRWKGHPWKSLAIVTVGQGVLDALAGAYTAQHPVLLMPFVLGTLGATLMVAAFYPLTQLYQLADDLKRGDDTLAVRLTGRGGREMVFLWSLSLLALALIYNSMALWRMNLKIDAALLGVAGILPVSFLIRWQNDLTPTVERDFKRIHGLMRFMALAFGLYVLGRLLW